MTFRITPPKTHKKQKTYKAVYTKEIDHTEVDEVVDKLLTSSTVNVVKNKLYNKLLIPIFNELIDYIEPYLALLCVISTIVVFTQWYLLRLSWNAVSKVEKILQSTVPTHPA